MRKLPTEYFQLLTKIVFLYRRYRELIDKNERTKALIRKRDEDRRAKAEKQLADSSLHAGIYMEQKRRALDYCTAKGNFGDVEKPIKRINNFKRATKSQAQKSRSPSGTLPNVRGAVAANTINIDLRVPPHGSKAGQKKQAKFKDGDETKDEEMLNLIEEQYTNGSQSRQGFESNQAGRSSAARLRSGLRSAATSHKSSTNMTQIDIQKQSSLVGYGRPPIAPGKKMRSSMALVNAKRAIGSKSSRQIGNSADQINMSVLSPPIAGSRQRETLQNPDGTPMTTEDFVRAVDKMNSTDNPAAIANFGLN